MERLTYTVAEVAQILGISRSKAYELVAEGLIPVVPLPGRRKLVSRAVLRRLLEGDGASPSGPTSDRDPNAADDSTQKPSTTGWPPEQRPSPAARSDSRPPPHTVAPAVRGRQRGKASDEATG